MSWNPCALSHQEDADCPFHNGWEMQKIPKTSRDFDTASGFEEWAYNSCRESGSSHESVHISKLHTFPPLHRFPGMLHQTCHASGVFITTPQCIFSPQRQGLIQPKNLNEYTSKFGPCIPETVRKMQQILAPALYPCSI